MELYCVVTILERNRAKRLHEIISELGISVDISMLGNGTATYEHLLFYNLEKTEKVIVSTIVTGSHLQSLINNAKKKMYMDIPGNGIMMAIPMKSVFGGTNLAYFTDGQDISGDKPAMDFKSELIIVILNEGHAEAVMDAARSAQAPGGTVLHAKGIGQEKARKFFGVSVAEEKDVIFILASSKKKSGIMKAINDKCGTQTPAHAISFSLPVAEVVGLRAFEEEEPS